MKKRIAALLLLLVMITGIVLTSCNNSTDLIDVEEVRRALTVTLYCITDDETTPEAIQKVEDAINQITKKRYSTQIKLRFYKESEYDTVIDNLVADIALEEKKKADDEAASASAAKESRRRAAIDKLISIDKAEVTTRKLIIWSTETEEGEVSEEETYETTQNIFGEDVEKYPDASDTQLDIFLICGTENLYKYVTEEPYASDDESFLVPMDESISLGSKAIKQYVNETILLAGKVGNVQYAIPTNRRMAGESVYLVLDRALVKKYGYAEDDMRNLTSAKFASYLDDLKENEPDVVPLRNEPDAPGIVSLFDTESIFGTYVANTAVTGFKAVPKNLLSAYQYTDHIVYMDQYKRNGYIPETVDENARFGAAVIKATEDEIEEYDESKYIVKVLGKGMATTETIGQYMFGISKYTRDVDRCMEIIKLITTNSEIRNLLQYGIEGYNYKIDTETGGLKRLNREYMMNIFATGNTFIAYPEEDMELDVWEKDKAANRSAIVSPYLGFLYEKPGNAELIEKMKVLSDEVLKQVKEFDVETRRLEKIAELEKQRDDYQKDADGYKEKLDQVAELAESYLTQIEAAKEELKPYTEALDAAKAAVEPYNKKINELNTEITSLKKQISDEKKKKPTDSDPDNKPDEAKIEEWNKKIEDDELEIRVQRGYSYELKKELAEAQAIYDEKSQTLKELEANYAAEKVNDNELSTVYKSRLNNYETTMNNVRDLQKQIDALSAPAQSEIDAKYSEYTSTRDSSAAKIEALTNRISNLNTEAKPYKDAVESAKAAVKEAEKKLEEEAEKSEEARRANAVALSYIEDKETEIANNKDEAKAEQLNSELETLKAEYDKTVAAGRKTTDAYDAAKADLEAKKAALDAANNAEVFNKISAAEAEMSEANLQNKNAESELSQFKLKSHEYYDEIASGLYKEFFDGIVKDLSDKNTDYQQFMNIGEEFADNENGVVYIYNEWYNSTYGG